MEKSTLASLALICLAFAISAYAFPFMPERMATHWGLSGEANGYSGREFALFFVPALMAAMFAFLKFLPRIMPHEKNFRKMQGQYGWLVCGITAFMLYVHLLTLAWNYGVQFSFGQALSPAFAALFYGIGAALARSRQNWLVGIRTPWTMSDEGVWERTHALAGRLFKAAGAIALLGLAFPDIALWLAIVPALCAGLSCAAYSYFDYRKTKKG